jgi:hypothetical protein
MPKTWRRSLFFNHLRFQQIGEPIRRFQEIALAKKLTARSWKRFGLRIEPLASKTPVI